MELPRPLMHLVDPANVYFARRSPGRRRQTYHGGTIFGPDVPGGSRQATADEIEQLRQRAGRRGAESARQLTTAEQLTVAQAAHELLHAGKTTLAGRDGAPVEATIRRFWRGDSVLEVVDAAGPRGLTRVPRNLTDEHQDLLASYLAQHITRN